MIEFQTMSVLSNDIGDIKKISSLEQQLGSDRWLLHSLDGRCFTISLLLPRTTKTKTENNVNKHIKIHKLLH